jgi:hypothetical protein
MIPIRDHTTLQQERAAYQVIRSFCQGHDLPKGHALLAASNKAEAAQAAYGYWGWTLLCVSACFQSHADKKHPLAEDTLEKRIVRTQRGLAIMCISDAELVALINRYAQEGEIALVFGQRCPLAVSAPYVERAEALERKLRAGEQIVPAA